MELIVLICLVDSRVIMMFYQVAWPSGLRRQLKALVSLEGWVRIPPLSILLCYLFTLNNHLG